MLVLDEVHVDEIKPVEFLAKLLPRFVRIAKRALKAMSPTSPGGVKITPEEREQIIWRAALELADALHDHLPKAEESAALPPSPTSPSISPSFTGTNPDT